MFEERERWGVGDATCDPAGCSDVTLGASTSGAEQRKGVHSGEKKKKKEQRFRLDVF